MSINSKIYAMAALESNRTNLREYASLLKPKSDLHNRMESIFFLASAIQEQKIDLNRASNLLTIINEIAVKYLEKKVDFIDLIPRPSIMDSLNLDPPKMPVKQGRNVWTLKPFNTAEIKPVEISPTDLLAYHQLTRPNTRLEQLARDIQSKKPPEITVEVDQASLISPRIDALYLEPPLFPTDHDNEIATPNSYLGCHALNVRLKKIPHLISRFNQAIDFITTPLNLITSTNDSFLATHPWQLPSKTLEFMRFVFERNLLSSPMPQSGGCATLHLTTLKSPKGDNHYVIKNLKKKDDIKSYECLIREAVISLKLKHDHILPIQAVFETGLLLPLGSCFFQKIIQCTLNDESTSPLKIKQYLHQTAHALTYTHRQGITHKDVKPENIVLLESKAYLIDFGLACETRKDTFVRGTVEYFAPEMFIKHSHKSTLFSNKIDVWAFGILMLESIFGCSISLIPFIESEDNPHYDVKSFVDNHFQKELPENFFDSYYRNEEYNTRFQHRDPLGEFVKIARKCLDGDPKRRPSMEGVTSMLETVYI